MAIKHLLQLSLLPLSPFLSQFQLSVEHSKSLLIIFTLSLHLHQPLFHLLDPLDIRMPGLVQVSGVLLQLVNHCVVLQFELALF